MAKGKKSRKRDERLDNGSVISWSRRFADGRYASGETRWRVPVRCGQCGQVREISASTVKGRNSTGLCRDCTHAVKTEDERLEGGSVVYWSQRSRGRYRVPVRCGQCEQVREVHTGTAQKPDYTGLCHACACASRTEDERLDNASVIYWSRRFGDGRYASGETRRCVPVRCGQCGEMREVTIADTRQDFTGLCCDCARAALRTTEDKTLERGSVAYWSQRFKDGRGRWRVPVRCGQCGQVREVHASAAQAPGYTGLCHACACAVKTKDERLANGSVVFWSQRFRDGRYANGNAHWRVPVRCGQCGQVREVRTSVAQTPDYAGLCSSCARMVPGSQNYNEWLRYKRGRCQVCGLAAPDILIVHHKDGDRGNNDEDNLAVLCPNDHARVHRGKIEL